MAHDVFISYSSRDKPTADAICATLESKQVRCWIAPRDVLPGVDYAESLIEAINECKVMLLVFSGNANESSQVSREVERATSKGVTIIPVRIEDVRPSRSLEYFLSSPHWLDAITPPLERHLDHLTETVKLLLARLDPSADQTEKDAVAGPAVMLQPSPGIAETQLDHDATVVGSQPPPPPAGQTADAGGGGRGRNWFFVLGGSAVGAALIGGMVALVMVIGGGGSSGADEATTTPTSSPTLTRSPSPRPATATATPTPTPELALRLPDCLGFSDAPQPCIEDETDIDVPDRVSPGDPITVTIRAENRGLDARTGVITVSSPDAQEIQIVTNTLPNDTVSVPQVDGMSICEQFGGGVCKAEDIQGNVAVIYPIAEGIGAWSAGAAQGFEAVVVPKPGASTVTIHIRVSLLSTDSAFWYIYPPSVMSTLGVQPAGLDEQQSFPVLKYTVEIAPLGS
jgi:hypothetical protein